MRRSSLRSRWARVAVAGAAAAGMAAAGLAGAAQAADGEQPLPVTITGPDRVDLALDGAEEEPGEPQISLGVTGPGEVDPDSDPKPVSDQGYTVTIDATALQGFAEVDLPCQANGLIAVCTEGSLYPGSTYNPRWRIRLDLKDGAEAGDFGAIKVTGAGEGLLFTEHTVDVRVGAADLLERKLPGEPEGFTAGDTYAARLGFRNAGGVPAEGVVLRFAGTRGLSFPDTYDNCSYTEENKDNLIRYEKVALCTFAGEFRPGVAYELSEPVRVKTAGFALDDIFRYGFSEAGAQKAAARSAGHRAATGKTLTLQQAGDGAGVDYVRYAEADLARTNTYDLDLTGARVAGERGETVTVDVGLRNHGPAWIGSLRSGGEPIGFTVSIPEGADVVNSPCRPMNEATPSEYLCWAKTPFLEDEQRTFRFTLRIDEVVQGAKGKIALPEWDDPREGDPSNDAGWIVLNGTGDEETPGDTSGTDGGTTGTTGGTDGGTASTGGTAGGTTGGTAGAATAGATGGSAGASTTGTDGGASPRGGLAATGSTALFTSAGAALALGAGGVLFAVSRRRRANDAA